MGSQFPARVFKIIRVVSERISHALSFVSDQQSSPVAQRLARHSYELVALKGQEALPVESFSLAIEVQGSFEWRRSVSRRTEGAILESIGLLVRRRTNHLRSPGSVIRCSKSFSGGASATY
jgi:CRP-like cAMP-binding protein